LLNLPTGACHRVDVSIGGVPGNIQKWVSALHFAYISDLLVAKVPKFVYHELLDFGDSRLQQSAAGAFLPSIRTYTDRPVDNGGAAGMAVGRIKPIPAVITFILSIVASFIAGVLLESTKPAFGKWLPWTPGTLKILVKHQTPQAPLVAAGELTRLVLKRDGSPDVPVDRPQSGVCTLCRLRPGSYKISAWVDDMLAISDCSADVTPGGTTEATCFLARPEAQLQIEVLSKKTGKPMTDVSVQIRSHLPGYPWRGPNQVDAFGRSPWNYLQATGLDSESYVAEVVKNGTVIASEGGIKLEPGKQTTKVIHVAP
jgi:hypothetical protein